MKIVVIGGTGLIGSKLVTKLTEHGHEAVPASPNSGVNTLTGEGLADVLTGAAVVVDVSNSPSFEDAAVLEFFDTSTRNLLDAEADRRRGTSRRAVGRRHRTSARQRLPPGEGRAGEADQGIGHPLLHRARDAVLRVREEHRRRRDCGRRGAASARHVPTDRRRRSRSHGRRVATGTPLNGTLEIGGPEVFRFDDLMRHALTTRNDPREVVTDPHARYFGTELGERSLVPDDGAQRGTIRFDDWLSQQAPGR